MNTTAQSLAELALTYPSASRIFRLHRLDFCCGGKRSMVDACAQRGLDADALLQEIEADGNRTQALDWREQPLSKLVDYILVNYHEAHRRELPDLIVLARKVERVHEDKATVPVGLAEHLASMHDALQAHMQKEEQILFPAILNSLGLQLRGPTTQMEREHDEHAAKLERLRELASNFVAPPAACTSWRALFLRCEQLEADIMAHVHLENHVLFPRALNGDR